MTIWDPGLQPERTWLAWRRTMLAFVVVSAVAVRFTVEQVGAFALAAGGAGIALSLLAFGLVERRHRAATRSLAVTGSLALGAWPLAVAVLAALVLGAAGIAYVVLAFFTGSSE